MAVMYAGPLIIATGLAVLFSIALAGTSGPIAIRIFRLGPFQLAPIVILWGIIVAPDTERWDLWRTLPLYGALVAALLWHTALVHREQTRRFYLVYATVHLPIFYLYWSFAMVLATRFPL
jgi:hypothetical protein